MVSFNNNANICMKREMNTFQNSLLNIHIVNVLCNVFKYFGIISVTYLVRETLSVANVMFSFLLSETISNKYALSFPWEMEQ